LKLPFQIRFTALRRRFFLSRAANIIATFRCVNTFVETSFSDPICCLAAAPLPVEGGEHYRHFSVRQHLCDEANLTFKFLRA